MENLPNKSGIYLIRSTVNDKEYVGSAVNLRKRKNKHFSDLKKGGHHSQYMQRHYNKHGDVLEFSILEYCDKNKLLEREQYYIDTMKPVFNTNLTAGSTLGMRHTRGAKIKISKASKCRIFSDEARRNMSKAQKNRKPISEETRQKMSKASKARVGRSCSEEARRNMSKAQKGKRRGPLSDEHKRKLSEAGKGRKHTEETKRKISEAHKGRKNSEEHIRKNSEAHKGQIPWNKGKSMTEERKCKQRETKARNKAALKI